VAATLGAEHVTRIAEVFDLGSAGRLSDGPVAAGKLGAIWRLDTDAGSWAVKVVDEIEPDELDEIEDGARFQERVFSAGVPTPAVRRTSSGDLIGEIGAARVRVHAWAQLEEPDVKLDPTAIGRLVAALHQVDFDGATGVHWWYSEPVGAGRWSELIGALRTAHAPFAHALDALVPELVSLEAYLGDAPRELRTCHRDLWADNVRRTRDGNLCVFDFDNAGLADPSQELALVLVEYGGDDARRARTIREAYADAGGDGRIDGPRTFAMVIAQLAHIVEEGCRRWLAATTDEARADNAAWVREFLDRPLTRRVVDTLVAACRAD
jgi:Ser/Thr protein kinase RdoA (MazF antagonist)